MTSRQRRDPDTLALTDPPLPPHITRRLFRWSVAAVLVALVASIVGATPWPSAMLIRSVFEQGGTSTMAEMNRHLRPGGVDARLNVATDVAGGSGTGFDVFTPSGNHTPLPTVVWVHGGAWISGSKENVDPYLRMITQHGYTTIGLDYTVGPEGTYPLAIHQLNDSLAYIVAHAAELNVDPDQIVIAGDSAGGQLASQLDVLITNPEYAKLMSMTPAIQPHQLVGTVLNCGVYELSSMADLDGIFQWGLKIALWAYTGTKDWSSNDAGSTMSTIRYVTPDFPPTYISGGNGDPLTWLESIPMSQKLDAMRVPMTTVFWPTDTEPKLPHEYQFHLDLPEARTALADTIAFLDAHTTR